MPPRKDLGAALLEEHAIRADALERARREQERSGRPLWALLLDAGLCTEEGIFLLLRRRSGAQVVGEDRLASTRVPTALRPAIPSELAGELGVLPLSLERIAEGKRVALAMVDPLAELPRLRAALARLGVVEVHRFLLHRALLRRYLVPAYLDAPQPTGLPLSDQPTGIITLPEHRPRGDERTERLPGRDRPLLSPPVQTAISRNAITQPLNQVALGSPSVQVDPQLVAEIEELARSPEPQRSGVHPARDRARSAEPTQVSRILRPDAPTEPARPAPMTSDTTGLEWPLPEARPRSSSLPGTGKGRPTAQMTSVSPSSLSPTVPTAAPAQPQPEATLAPLLCRIVRALAQELEARLPQDAQRPAPRAATLARLAERAATTLGLVEHNEIGLLALLHGIERRLLAEGGIQPGGLGLCLRDLQAALCEGEGSPDNDDDDDDDAPPAVPDAKEAARRPARDVVRCAAAALDLTFAGVLAADLPARLAEAAPVPQEILDAVLRAMKRPEAGASQGPDPDRTDELSLPGDPPEPPSADDVDDAMDPSEPEIEIEVAEGDEGGLEIMQTQEK